jgi:hypothetical protein
MVSYKTTEVSASHCSNLSIADDIIPLVAHSASLKISLDKMMGN